MNKKKITTMLLCLLMLFSLAACNKQTKNEASTTEAPTTEAPTTEEATTPATVEGCDFNIAAMKGPTAIGLVKLLSDSDNGASVNTYKYTIYGTADDITTKLIKGELDVAAVPCNLASVLYNKSEGEIVIAAVNTLGVLYMLEKGYDDIASVADLKGKTIYTTGEGTTPEYTLRYMLSSNGIDPDNDVTINYLSGASAVVSTISTMDQAVVMLPQPYVTVAMNSDTNLKQIFDVTEEWEKADSNSSVVTGVLVARKSFIKEHADQFDAFLEEYKLSADYANEDVEGCADLVESFDIFKAAIAKKAIPACNVVCITGNDMKDLVLPYLNVLYTANAKAVGGTMPDENIFYLGE